MKNERKSKSCKVQYHSDQSITDAMCSYCKQASRRESAFKQMDIFETASMYRSPGSYCRQAFVGNHVTISKKNQYFRKKKIEEKKTGVKKFGCDRRTIRDRAKVAHRFLCITKTIYKSIIIAVKKAEAIATNRGLSFSNPSEWI